MKNSNQTTGQGLRLYFFVMYNLSGIQKGIQAGHAALEYANKYGKTKEYKDFINNHKTFIVLDGGTSSTMVEREQELELHGIKFASFQEPDLNHSVSAIAFLVPEEVYSLTQEDIDSINYNYRKSLGANESHYKNAITATYLKQFRLASN